MSKNNRDEKSSKIKEANTQWKSNQTIVMKVQLEKGKSKDCEKK
jgi:hypothetical protein